MGADDDTPTVDLDPGEWSADAAPTQADDAVPVAIDGPVTKRNELTDLLEEARRRAYEGGYDAGFIDGRERGEADGESQVNRLLVEEVLDLVRAAFVIFDAVDADGRRLLDITEKAWAETIEPWVRLRLKQVLPP